MTSRLPFRLPLLFLGIFSLMATGWFYAAPEPYDPEQVEKAKHQPDAIVTGLRVEKYTPEGFILHRLSAPKMVHYPHENTSVFTKPHIESHRREQAKWQIEAIKATSKHNNQVVQLEGNVLIHQQASPNNIANTIQTDHLDYYPDTKIAQTDAEITLQQPGLLVKSKGIKADLNKETVTLIANARGRYEPTKRPNKA